MSLDILVAFMAGLIIGILGVCIILATLESL